jgi:hypothetical protein
MTLVRARRLAVGMAVGLATVGATAIGGATTASAQPGGPDHYCEEIAPNDDGALLDPLHHSIELLIPAFHKTNCYLQSSINGFSCSYLPFLAWARGSTGTFPPCGF